jgi:hypothetical protein
MTKFAAGINELDVDLLQSLPLSVGEERLAECKYPLLDATGGTTDHNVIVIDFSVMGEASEWGDGLLRQIVLCGGVVLDHLAVLSMDSGSNTVQLLVDLCTVMVTFLTTTGYREGHTGRMPSSNTSYLTQTLVSLTGQLLCVPSGSHTFESLSLCDSDDIDHLVLGKHSIDLDLLLQMLTSPLYFVGYGSTVDLDLHQMSLLLPLLQKLHLGMGNHTDHLAVLLYLSEISLDLLLARLILPFLGGLGESLLL